ncbi:multisubunit sodium/proton antiporter, MrpE subunit [Mesobacillus persicus]|uniref:Multisubunit sodium/proton antiporter, MrpE subunit n=1 Tax=Mesobacillus persicus TaxID=930146 RepID=A0A1H7ZU43_9BACI|nr:Na+/H+ antiporter subunit E [Mesobacillus persicus]SEM61304.1 multisubunit sodium/proton antiporter, MrpE subunit [Mesobacillus persicus]
MAFQMLLNFFLAFLWMFLKTSFTPAAFVVGFFWGLVILFIFRSYFPDRFYLHRVVAIIKLFLLFIKELILSNLNVLKHVLKPKMDIKPGIFALPIDLQKDWEIMLLGNLITLTPGTLTVDISDDNKILYIHAVNIDDVKESVDSIKNTFEKAIMEVSR